MAVSVINAAASVQPNGYPTSGTVAVNCAGANVLYAVLYNNTVITGGAPTMKYNGVTMTQVTDYKNSVTANYGQILLYSLKDPFQGLADLSYAQAVGNSNTNRALVALPIKDADTDNPLTGFVGLSRPRNIGMPYVQTIDGINSGDLVINATFGYYLTNAPSSSTGSPLLSGVSSGSNALRYAVNSVVSGGAEQSFNWTIDSFNDATSMMLSIKGAPGTARPPSTLYMQDGAGGHKLVTVSRKAP